MTRDGQTAYDLLNLSAFVQDTYTHNRLTAQIGVRYDFNHDQALASSVDTNPLVPQLLPGITFPGADPGVKFNNFSPRLGFTYDLTGTGKTLAKVNYAMYLGSGGHGRHLQSNQPGYARERAVSVDRSERRQVRPGERGPVGQQRRKDAVGRDRQLGSEQPDGGHHREHGRSELEERSHRRVHRRLRSRDRPRLRRRRQLHLAAVRRLPVHRCPRARSRRTTRRCSTPRRPAHVRPPRRRGARRSRTISRCSSCRRSPTSRTSPPISSTGRSTASSSPRGSGCRIAG